MTEKEQRAIEWLKLQPLKKSIPINRATYDFLKEVEDEMWIKYNVAYHLFEKPLLVKVWSIKIKTESEEK